MTESTTDFRKLAKQPLHQALHDLDVRIPGLPGDCHCNLVSEVVLDAVVPLLGARRDDAVAAWLKHRRDEWPKDSAEWAAVNWVLDDYRDHADTGTPLDREVPGPHEEVDL